MLARQPSRQLQHRCVALDRGDGCRQRSVQVPARVPVAVEVRRRGFVDLAEGQLDQAVDDRPLVGEVEVERGSADERATRDRIDRDALVGLFRECRARGVEDRGFGVVARASSRCGDPESLRRDDRQARVLAAEPE
jgi:hypothetical protein